MCVLSYAEYGGLGLDFTYSVAVAEELGNIRCGGIPMAIGVQSDMATPALARYNPTNNDIDTCAEICHRGKVCSVVLHPQIHCFHCSLKETLFVLETCLYVNVHCCLLPYSLSTSVFSYQKDN